MLVLSQVVYHCLNSNYILVGISSILKFTLQWKHYHENAKKILKMYFIEGKEAL